jgi:hypothetical protein
MNMLHESALKDEFKMNMRPRAVWVSEHIKGTPKSIIGVERRAAQRRSNIRVGAKGRT